MRRRCAIYCRVSSADQDCARQEAELLNYAVRADYQVMGTWKEIASGSRNDRAERKKILALAQKREIDCILVTELTRWGRSTLDLITTLHQIEAWKVSLIALSGWQFDLSTPHGKLIAGIMANLAEFERDLLRERVKSGLVTSRAAGKKLGRQVGQRVVADKVGARVLQLVENGQSYRQIAKDLKIATNTVLGIVKRHRAKDAAVALSIPDRDSLV